MKDLTTFLKGLAMGAADVVPGVSGGTIAFITGIYDLLLESIRRINPSLLGYYRRHGLKDTLAYINLRFLLVLLSGIVCSIVSFARIISWLLVHYPIPLWAFFFGLILVSVHHIMRQVKPLTPLLWGALAAGTCFAWIITQVHPVHLAVSPITLLLSGMLAICAMILPGISGSFILLLIGMYAPILDAVRGAQISLLLYFVMGCVLGLLSFSHVLSWLLRHYRALTLSFLTGLMLGTLPKIWPWKQTLTWRTNSKGEQVPLLQDNLSPWAFEQLTGQHSQWLLAIATASSAIMLVLMMERVAERGKATTLN